MLYHVEDVAAYLTALPDNRKEPISRLRQTIIEHLPAGFEESLRGGIINYEVPLSAYPAGYHCTPGKPLPFLALASQKNHIALYHMGIYMDEELAKWFVTEYAKVVPTKLDMGKSCIRMKNPKHIPYDLIGELVEKMSLETYIERYEQTHLRK